MKRPAAPYMPHRPYVEEGIHRILTDAEVREARRRMREREYAEWKRITATSLKSIAQITAALTILGIIGFVVVFGPSLIG